LRLTNPQSSGTGSLTVSSGGNLNLLTTLSKSVANSGTITIGAGGAVTISGLNNVLTVGGIISAGSTYTLLSGTSLTNTGSITITVSGGVATLNNASSITGGITVTGGTAAFNAANTVSGAVAASGGGAISLGSMSGVGSGSISLDNGKLISTLASSTLTNVVAVGTGGGTVANASGFTLSGNVTGTSSLTASGPGELVISGSLSSSTIGMAVNVLAGASGRLTGSTLKYFNNTGTVSGTLTFDNATLVMRTPAAVTGTGSIVLVGATTISGSTGVGSTASISTAITGAGGLTFNGASSRYVILGGSNTYSGGTQLNGDVGASVSSAFGTGSVTSLGTGARINNTSAGVLVVPNILSTTSTTTNVLVFTGANPIQIAGTVTGAGILRASSSGIIDISQQTLSTMQATGSIEMGNGAMIKASSAANFGSLTAILVSGTPAPTLQAQGNTGSITQPVKCHEQHSSSTPDGTYTLMSGLTSFDLTNVSNVGAGSAYSLGSGKTAYLQTASSPNAFQLVVVPEPTSLMAAGCGGFAALLVLARRGRAR